jgi:hypothetical protein
MERTPTTKGPLMQRFAAACVLHTLTRTDITVEITSADAWRVTMTDGARTSEMDARYPGDDAHMLPWPLPDGIAPDSRAAALDLLEWLAFHGERLAAAGTPPTKFRPSALRLFVHDEGYNNPAYGQR